MTGWKYTFKNNRSLEQRGLIEAIFLRLTVDRWSPQLSSVLSIYLLLGFVNVETKRNSPVERKFERFQSIHHRQNECETHEKSAEDRAVLEVCVHAKRSIKEVGGCK